MNPDRVHFGARLRQQRESRSLSVPDIVKITKIPEKSLVHLEDGAFEDLPADVFVRGFLKSYCKAVGLDAEATLAEYHELTRGPGGPKAPPSLARLASAERAAQPPPPISKPHPVGAAPPSSSTGTGTGGEPSTEHAAAPVEAPAEPEEPSIFAALASAGRSTSRASLTIAVVILVIVATLTLSLLLRRPGHVGDRVSAGPRAPAALT